MQKGGLTCSRRGPPKRSSNPVRVLNLSFPLVTIGGASIKPMLAPPFFPERSKPTASHQRGLFQQPKWHWETPAKSHWALGVVEVRGASSLQRRLSVSVITARV